MCRGVGAVQGTLEEVDGLEVAHPAFEAQVGLLPPVLLVAVLGLDRWVLVVPEIVVRALEPLAVDGVGARLVQAETTGIPVDGIRRRGGAEGGRGDGLWSRRAGSLGVGGISVGHPYAGAGRAAGDLAKVVFGDLVALAE